MKKTKTIKVKVHEHKFVIERVIGDFKKNVANHLDLYCKGCGMKCFVSNPSVHFGDEPNHPFSIDPHRPYSLNK